MKFEENMKYRWAFRWIGGGWNEVMADRRYDAVEKAVKLGTPKGRRVVRLRPDLTSFRKLAGGERNPYYQFID